MPSVRVRDHELVPVDPLRRIHGRSLRPERTGKALEGDVLSVGRPDGPPIVGLALGDPNACGQLGVRRRSPVPSGLTTQIECTPEDGARAKTMRDPSGDQSAVMSSVPLGGCVSLRTPVPSAFMTKSSPHGVFWRRSRSKTMRPFVPGGVACDEVAVAATIAARATRMTCRRVIEDSFHWCGPERSCVAEDAAVRSRMAVTWLPSASMT